MGSFYLFIKNDLATAYKEYWSKVISQNPDSEKLKVIYCNKFAGFYSQWKFITLKTQYTTVDHSSQLF
jgi:hypothetical protein